MSFVARPRLAALCGLALIGLAATASAGLRWAYPVFISDSSRYAVGTLSDARASADSVQYIGCYHNSSNNASCYATNASGLSRSCSTSNPAHLTVIRSIGAESYVYFQWNTDGTCNYILVDNGSRFKPAATSGF